MSGKVFLVGAGPGDPRLLTLRGAEVLGAADVVVHDRLVAPALLDLAPARAERVDVGKAPGRPRPVQDAINRLLVSRAREGKMVVRLKGGDPFVFGRGGEEALACARAGVPFEVVPGVSSAVAAPAYLGIPLTHRGLSSSVGVATAVAAGGQPVDLGPVARAVDTLVVLMVAGRLGKVCEGLVRAGRPPGEPAAVVQWATTSRQRSVLATLGELPALAEGWGVGPPATLVVGPVVALAEPLAWFEHDRRSYLAGARPTTTSQPGPDGPARAANRAHSGTPRVDKAKPHGRGSEQDRPRSGHEIPMGPTT